MAHIIEIMKLEELLQATPEHQITMFQALTNRNHLLTKINGIDLWIYDVENNMFNVMFRDGEGNVRSSTHPILDYEETPEGIINPSRPLCKESQIRWNAMLHNLSVDPSLPEEGHIDLDYKNRTRRVRSYYKVSKDAEGKIKFISGTSEDISKTQEHMKAVIESQNEYIRVINGLKSTFKSIIYIDLQDYSFKLLESSMRMRNFAEQFTNAQEFIDDLIAKTFLPEYKQEIKELSSLDTIKQRLADRRYISFEYQNTEMTWLKLKVLPAEYTPQGELTHIIVTSEIVDEEHKTLDQLKIKSERDGLTGLYNRSTGVAQIEQQLHEESGLLALFDCDKFKLINDTYGHLVGDKVLIVVAQTLQKVFEGQVVFRLGGDEFVSYLTQSFIDKKAAEGINTLGIFQQLRAELSNVDIPELCGQCPSISFGVAKSDKDNLLPFDELYKTADISLYQCKKYGRIDLHKM